jgi:hypothetical protein
MLRELLLGSGRFGDARRAELRAEGVLLLIEGASGSLTSRNLRAPRERANWRKEAVRVAVAVTRVRLVCERRGGKLADVPFDHPGVAGMTTGTEGDDRLVIAWDCALIRPDVSGTQELRLRTPEAARAVAVLRKHGLGVRA